MPYVAKDSGSWSGWTVQRDAAQEPLHALPGVRDEHEQAVGPSRGMLAEGKTATPEYAELKRRFGWEWNGMRLHEFYFENLGGKGALDPASKLGRRSPRNSASAGEVGSRLPGRGRDARDRLGRPLPGQGGRPPVQPVGQRARRGESAGAVPLLVMDVFEHAFMVDYGLKRADYIAAFFRNVNWKAAEARLS